VEVRYSVPVQTGSEDHQDTYTIGTVGPNFTFSGLQRRPENVAHLRAYIVKLCRALSEDLCRKVVTNARVRLQEVVRQSGGHVEHVLH